MKNKINVALQVLPMADGKDMYRLVDSAIEVIQKSGLKYKVCPFETVIEGYYDEVMDVVRRAQEACYAGGAEKMIVYVKIQHKADNDVFISDKMEKYE